MGRSTATLAALALSVLLLSACTSTAGDGGEGKSIVVEAYGAEYEELFDEVIAKPFTRETGIQVQYQTSGSATQGYAKIMASGGDPDFDITTMTNVELYQGRKDGLLAPVSAAEVPNIDRLAPKLREATYGVGVIQDVQYVSLMYSKSRFPTPPTSWKVMWDPQYRAGSLIFNPANLMGAYFMITAAELDGGGIDNMEPGFKRVSDLAPYAIGTPTKSAEAVPFMEQREATVFPYLDGRAAIYAKTTDYDFTLPDEGAYGLLGSLAIPEASPNKAAAYKLMDFWLRPDIQKRWAEAYNVGPSVTGLTFDEEFTDKHIVTPASLDKLQLADPEKVLEHRTDWSQRWAEAAR